MMHVVKKVNIGNPLEIESKVWLGLFLLGILSSGCVQTKRLPDTFVETSPVEEVSQNKPEAEIKKTLEKKSEHKTSAPQKPLKDSRTDAVARRFQKAIEYLKKGKIEKAKMLFEALRDQYPGVSVFHHNLGIVYKRLGRIDVALEAYQQAIGQNPNGGDPESHYNLAIAFREQGAFKKAENAYRVAITLAPDFEDAHFNLAVLYDLYLDDPEKALEHYQHQIELSGKTDKEIEIWVDALKKRLIARGSQE